MQRNADISKQLARFMGAFESGDVSLVEALVSREKDLLGIGSDPDEWWPDRENLIRAAEAQIPEMHSAGMRIQLKNERSLSEGDVGWSGAQAALVVPEVGEVPMRFTSVWHRESGEWRLVQFHLSVGVSNEDVLGEELPT
jgi:hypothetical protein